MAASLFTVSFVSSTFGSTECRYFSTLRAARKWAKWLGSQPYAGAVKIYRGREGGCLLETAA